MITNLLLSFNASYSFVMLLFSLVLPLIGFMFHLARRQPPHGSPPYPWRLPIIGNLHQLTRLPHKGLHKLSQKYGPLMSVYIGSTPYFVMSSGDMVREMMSDTHKNSVLNRPNLRAARILFRGSDDIIFSTNSQFWRKARKLCVNELLSIKRVRNFHYILEEEVGELIAKLRTSLDRPIDLSALLLAHSSSIIFRVILGLKCTDYNNNNNDDDDGDGAAMGVLMKQAADFLTTLDVGDFIPALSWWNTVTGFDRKGLQISRNVHAFLDRVIDEHEKQQAAAACHTDDDDEKKRDFLQIILEHQKNDDNSFTRDNIKAILLNMFIAGTDTSATLIEWTMAELAKHPTIMKKLQDEIRSIVGAHQQRISQHDIDQMDYLHCVVKESLRLYSPYTTFRQASEDVTICGFKLPAKSVTLFNLWSIHRDPNTWDSPLEFLPERFLNNNRFDFTAQDHKYIPFGVGKRICPGSHLAISEVKYGIANLLCWFNWDLPDGMTVEDLDMSETAAHSHHKKISLCLVPSAPHT